ncbi:MAG: hypothetical protein P4L77_11835 [Sulfuriferula sp.]|nr:hypothetical protein [Sulfuriferula sp.]
MNNQETRALYAKMREFSKNLKINMVTAQQPPRPEGYRAPPPPVSDVIIVDYITLIRK